MIYGRRVRDHVTSLAYFLALAGFFGLAFQLQRRTTRETNVWLLLGESSPLSCALILLAVGLSGRMLHRFDLGVFVGAGICIAWAAYLWRSSSETTLTFRLPFRWVDLPLILFGGLSTWGMGVLAFRYAYHDERMVQGHPALVESLLRGTYPLVFLSFPELPNKYHIGFDLVAAMFCRLLHLPGYQGVDVATVFLWVLLSVALALLLRRLGVSRRHLAAALAFVVFSGGLSWWLAAREPGPWQIPEWQYFSVAGRLSHFHFLFDFFQHPISLGALLFVGVLRYFHEWSLEPRPLRLALLILVLGALSLAHVMFFATGLAALGIWFFFRLFAKDISPRDSLLSGLAVLFGAVGLAFALGGFFQMSSGADLGDTLKFAWPPGYLRHEFFAGGRAISLWQVLIWYFGSLGVFLLVLPLGIYDGLRQRVAVFRFLVIYCLLSFFISQFFYYGYSTNIQKWFLSFDFSGKILCAAACFPRLARRRNLVLAYLLVGFSLVTPVRFMVELAWRNPRSLNSNQRRMAGVVHSPPQGGVVKLTEFFRDPATELGTIWANGGLSRTLAIYTGYPVLEIDNAVAMPIPRDTIRRRQEELRQLNSQPSMELLQGMKIRWVVFSCGEIPRLSPAVQQFLEVLQRLPQVENHSLIPSAEGCFLVLKIPKV